jgi:guanine deaminase
MKTLHGTLLRPGSPEQCEVLPEMSVRIGDDGCIAEIGSDRTRADDVIGGDGCWLLPGFIDAHLHLSQWDRRGLDIEAGDWLTQVVYPAEIRLKDAEFAEQLAEDFTTGLISCGTTTALAYGAPSAEATDRAFRVFERRGLRAIFGRLLNDTNCPDPLSSPADQQLDETRDLSAKWHGAANGRLAYAFSPRSLLTCSEELLRGAAALADVAKCYLHTHAGKSSAEISAIHDRFPDTMDDIDLLSEFGLLGERTVLAHGVFIDPYERHRLAETRTTLVHTPTADLFHERGVMDLIAYRRAGVRLALGSSIAGGTDPFMPRAAVSAIQAAKVLRISTMLRRSSAQPNSALAWWLLTAGAAEALGIGSRVGTLDQGYEADCLVVRPEAWINALPEEHQASALLYTLRPDQIEHVFIAGKRVGPNQ